MLDTTAAPAGSDGSAWLGSDDAVSAIGAAGDSATTSSGEIGAMVDGGVNIVVGCAGAIAMLGCAGFGAADPLRTKYSASISVAENSCPATNERRRYSNGRDAIRLLFITYL